MISFEMQGTAPILTYSHRSVEDTPPDRANDWSFASLKKRETLWGPHGYHRYSAKFIPQLVRRIIDTYSCSGDLIGDTFVGSATTGIEALRSGRHFWGSDVNSVALLIGHAKCVPLPTGYATRCKQTNSEVKKKISRGTWKETKGFDPHIRLRGK